MTLAYFAGRKITGTNSDRTGGTWTNLPAGWIFTETDTFLEYYWNGTTWTRVGVKSRIQFNAVFGSVASSSFTARFDSISNAANFTATESQVQLTYPFDFTVVRAIAKMNTNGVNGNSVFAFRDDAADVTGTVLTIPAGSLAEVDSGALSVAVAAGSKICFRHDTSASSTGTWLMSHYLIIGEITL